MAGAANRLAKGLALVVLLLLAVALYRHFELGRLLTLDSLKASRDSLLAQYQLHPFATLAIFFAAYVASAALSIPGATILTLAAGAMFGLATGLVLISFASSVSPSIVTSYRAFTASPRLAVSSTTAPVVKTVAAATRLRSRCFSSSVSKSGA